MTCDTGLEVWIELLDKVLSVDEDGIPGLEPGLACDVEDRT